MPKFCQACGIGVASTAKFCSGCGIGINEPQENKVAETKDAFPETLNEKIRVNLKDYTQHLSLTCLECGYVGLMGVSRNEEGKAKKRLILLAAIFFLLSSIFTGGVGLIFSVGIGIYIALDSSKRDKTFVVCPSCLLELKVNK
jgi:hypothetical protein